MLWIVLGFILFAIGMYCLSKAIYYSIRALFALFWSENKLDKELFNQWSKEKDYKKFKDNIK